MPHACIVVIQTSVKNVYGENYPNFDTSITPISTISTEKDNKGKVFSLLDPISYMERVCQYQVQSVCVCVCA